MCDSTLFNNIYLSRRPRRLVESIFTHSTRRPKVAAARGSHAAGAERLCRPANTDQRVVNSKRQALGMAEPPAGADQGRQQVDAVIVDVLASHRAAAVEMAPPVGRPTTETGGRRGDDEMVKEESSGPAAAPAPSNGAVPEVTVPVDPLECVINEERQRVEKTQKEAGTEDALPCIWKVHPSIRGQDGEDYEPKLVSIGPLHRDKECLRPMEDIKLSYLNSLLGRSEGNKLSNYIRVIRAREPRARKEYAEEIKLTPDEFVRMLVLDGCFIIEYLLKRVFKETNKTAQLAGVRWGFSHLRRDLMLLENQIPFFILVDLFAESTVPFKGKRQDPLTLMEITLGFLHIDQLPKERRPQVDEVRHLLHLHHICLNPNIIPDEPPHCSITQVLLYPYKVATLLISIVFFGLLYLLLVRKWPCFCFRTEEPGVPRMIPCATQLHKSGVKFKKKDEVSSFLKVSFIEGKLEIPFLAVQESTGSMLRNFIALEQCCPQVGSHFTSYAVLMDNIINTQGDVAILQKHGIIESKLGSDEEVAKLFNGLCKGTHLDYKKHYNATLFKNVKEYSEVPHHRWRASLKSTHFSNPWSTIAFCSGILIFAIAITQAYFNIFRRRK